MVGYTPEELANIDPGFDEQAHSAGNPNRHRNKSEGQETRWRHRDGRAIDVMVFESPLVDGLGQQVGWMGSIVDVTERKRLEEMERRQREALANHARLSTLGEVASTLAHELNQPLTSIVGYSAGIATALQKQARPDAELVAAAQALAHHASQAGDIVHRIRARLARREPNYGYFEINPIVTHAVTLLQRDLKRAGADVNLHLDEHLPTVSIDRIGIEQVISNLLRNASDAMSGKNGTRTIDVRTCLSTRTRIGRSESWVSVEVTDSGTGLGGHDIETLTEPFFSTKQEGTGLGLAICRSILESHGGVLFAENAPSDGACFGFALPPANPLCETHAP
jgi:two-component system sensor histidine kinase DctS